MCSINSPFVFKIPSNPELAAKAENAVLKAVSPEINGKYRLIDEISEIIGEIAEHNNETLLECYAVFETDKVRKLLQSPTLTVYFDTTLFNLTQALLKKLRLITASITA